jgi:hypothetical protein
VSLADIADELYALPLDEFTAARNARAKGEPAAKSLPKPSAAAWAINQFARSSPERLQKVFELGAQLREAQDQLDATTMRALGEQRRALLSALASEISTTAAMRGDIEQTLQAAMADEDAATAVASGRLVRTLSSDGLDAADLEGAVAAPVTGSRPRRPAPKAPSAAARKKATAALEAARADREAQQKQVGQLDEKVAAAADSVDDARAELDRLESKATAARAKLDHATADAARLAKARAAAAEKVERAEAAEDRARERLEALD